MDIKELNHPKFFRGVRSEGYNYNFCKDTGYFKRWGKTEQDDPTFSPVGPEILDCEITVNSCPNNCKFCYKGNTNAPATNMTFETFKIILDKIPSVMQVAFGITGTQSNPDFIKMMLYCREKGVIPNFTLSGIDATEEFIKESSKIIGAVAVSAYQTDKNVCYNTVQKYIDSGVKQTNIHIMLSNETKDFVWEVIKDTQTDKRLEHLNALVLLALKPKGRAKTAFNTLPYQDFKEIVEYCLKNGVKIGFDSCSACKFIKVVKELDLPNKEQLIQCSEPCESGKFSSYINVFGRYFPCSFAEGQGEWEQGIDVNNSIDFLIDVWYSNRVVSWREQLNNNPCVSCNLFDLDKD